MWVKKYAILVTCQILKSYAYSEILRIDKYLDFLIEVNLVTQKRQSTTEKSRKINLFREKSVILKSSSVSLLNIV